MLNRRQLLRSGAQLTLLAPSLRLVQAATPEDARFVFVILRGGLDGLAAVAPYAEPRYAQLRGELALASPGSADGVLRLDGLFGLIRRSRICIRCTRRASSACCMQRQRPTESVRISTGRRCSKRDS